MNTFLQHITIVTKTLLLGGPLLLAACATANRPGDLSPGYTETQLGRNVFAVRLDDNASPAATRSIELCLLRCAEVTLAYGFSYFVVLENLTEQATAIPTGAMVRATSPSGGVSFVNSDAGLPSSANTIACFRRQPSGYQEAYEAEAVFAQLSTKYGVRHRSEPRANPLDASVLQFSLYPNFLFLTKTKPDEILFLEPSSTQQTIVIGVLNDWENPCETLEGFRTKAAEAGAALGAHAVQIRAETNPTNSPGSANKNGFAADLLLIPRARLGLRDEGGYWLREEFVVRGFSDDSLAPMAGLRAGDRILELNGVDVRRENRSVDGWLGWNVGDNIVVTFVRDGTKMSLQAPTVAN